jgi:hypothetical protein
MIRFRRACLASLALTLAAAATAAGTAGCGAATAVDPVAQAASASTGAPGYTMTMSMALSSPFLPKPITMTGGGRYNVADRSGTFTMRAALPNIPSLARALGGTGLTMREIVEGTVVYVQLPPKLSPAAGGKPWLKIDLARGGAMPGGLSLLGGNLQSDPSQMLGYLRSISGSVTTVGTDTVEGVKTTHYRATVDLDKAAAQAPPAKRSAAERSVHALEQMAHVTKLPVDVWVDSRHLVRKYVSHFGITVQGAPLTMDMTMLFPHYGSEPKATPPPAAQVKTLSHLATPHTTTGRGSTPTA